jgi:formylglycine-generating enzyme required for sulfatase activity
MAGNAWEWVQDWYHESYEGAPADGSAWESPAGSGRVVRGGSLDHDVARYFRVGYRSSYGPGDLYSYLSLRPARASLAMNKARHAKERADARDTSISWVTIPGGSFTMGDDEWFDSKPRHQVTVNTFQMAKTLVTNKQYKACVAAGACTAANDHGASFNGDDQPVVGVTWDQAKAFSEWAGGRLPSEAEWEYAARSGGKEKKYPWGDAAPTCERSVMSQGRFGCGRKATWPVCSKPSGNTEQGLCDMAGNAWEWVQDWYHDSYEGAPADGSAWESPAGSGRVVRGGSWNFDVAGIFRAGYRNYFGPGAQGIILSLRPARSL